MNIYLPKGEYVIADPCHVLSDDLYYNKIVNHVLTNISNPLLCHNGYTIAVFRTTHGDGCYLAEIAGNQLKEIGVDSGLIACIPFELVDQNKYCGNEDDYIVFDRKQEFCCTLLDDALVFANVTINMESDDYYEDDYYDEDEEDEEDEDL